MYIYTTIAALVAGYVLDLCIGDPHGMWHPICFVGNLISFLRKDCAGAEVKEQIWQAVFCW